MIIPWTKVFIGIAIVSVIGGGFLFIKSHLANDKAQAAELATQKRFNEELTYQLAREQAARKAYKERVDASLKSLEMVQGELEESRKLHRQMVGVFERHDLSALILAKPGLITNRMRSGTDRLWRDFEAATIGKTDGDRQPLPTPPAD